MKTSKSSIPNIIRQWTVLFTLSLLFIIACRGQNNTGSERSSVIGSDAYTRKYVDPLFFIEGQLCQHLRRIHQDKNGNLWFGTNVYGLMRYDGDSLVYFEASEGLRFGRITTFVEDDRGNLWIGSAIGLTKYDGITFKNYTEKDGLINNEIWDVIINRNGEFVICTAEGVSLFDGNNFRNLEIPQISVQDTNTVLSYKRVNCVLEDGQGKLWFGKDGFGISIYDGVRFQNITKEDGLCDNNVTDLLEDKEGNIWISTMFGGVCKYDGKNYNNYSKDGVIDGVEVSGFYVDKEDNIWFAAENQGVYRYDGQQFKKLTEKQGLQTNGILDMFQDREGRFWFGGWGGLFRYDGEYFINVTKDGPWE